MYVHLFIGRIDFLLTKSTTNPDNSSGPARHPTEASISHKEIEETAAPQPRRPPKLAGIEPRMEPRCGKCLRSEPLLREAAFNLSKLSESLASGPLSEIISQVSHRTEDRVTFRILVIRETL